jgi:predicted amidohydrolase
LDNLSVSLLQMKSRQRAEENVTRMEELARAISEPPDLLILPEMWIGEGAAQNEAKSALEAVSRICRTEGIFAVTGGLPWMAETGLTIRTWIIDDLGRAFASYDNVHLSSRDGQEKIFTHGKAPLIFNIGEVTCAALSGYDLMFPEFCRQLSLSGARVFFVSAGWPAEFHRAWEFTLCGCAFLNQSIVAACNRTGDPGGKYFGRSAAVSPRGDLSGQLGEEEGSLSFSLELPEIAAFRKLLPIERDRRREFYSILS